MVKTNDPVKVEFLSLKIIQRQKINTIKDHKPVSLDFSRNIDEIWKN